MLKFELLSFHILFVLFSQIGKFPLIIEYLKLSNGFHHTSKYLFLLSKIQGLKKVVP